MENQSEPIRILIVEDDPATRLMLQHYLKKKYEVYSCDAEVPFYEKINSIHFNVILMDISLGGIKDGLQLTTEIKADPRFKHIPVICMTAHAFQEDEENAFNAGVDAYMKKPISMEKLNQLIVSFIENKP
ncbi:MAG: response regulator [bacterium]